MVGVAMRRQFPTSLDDEELMEYIIWLAIVGIIFVSVAIFLYISIIIAVIVSKKSNTARIVKWQKAHAKKAHRWFIFTTLFVGILVLAAVAFGVLENKYFHDRIVTIANHPRTIMPPAAKMIGNINSTVGRTGDNLNGAIVEINDVLMSVATILDSLQIIQHNVDLMVVQFHQMEVEVRAAAEELAATGDYLDTLHMYESQGFIADVPTSDDVRKINDEVNSTLAEADDFLNSTVTSVKDVLDEVNSTIAGAVKSGTTQVNKSKGTISSQIGMVHGQLKGAIDSLGAPNKSIISITDSAIMFEGVRNNVIIGLFVFSVIPIMLIYVGLAAKIPNLFKVAFILSFLAMFWLFAFGGVFTILHTAFSEACESRDVLVINAVHKFAPNQYKINLGNLNVGNSQNFTKTEIIINLDTPTLQKVFTCSGNTSFFDVFGLSPLMMTLFGTIYDALDQLEKQQSDFFSTNDTDYLDFNFNFQLDDIISQFLGVQNVTSIVDPNTYNEPVVPVQDRVNNVTNQADGLATQANSTVDAAITGLNNVTSNVTTRNGDQFSFFYTIANVTGLNPLAYPFSDTTDDYRDKLVTARDDALQAVGAQQDMIDIVNNIYYSADGILNTINGFQGHFSTTLNISTAWNESLADIQYEIAHLKALMPMILGNITRAIANIRDILGDVNDNLRVDTYCAFAGSFYFTLTDEICVTSTTNAEFVSAALLVMGFAYFLICLLGVGLLKRTDVQRLMRITDKIIERSLARIASIATLRSIVQNWRTSEENTEGLEPPQVAHRKEIPHVQGIFAHITPPPTPPATPKIVEPVEMEEFKDPDAPQLAKTSSLQKVGEMMHNLHKRATSLTTSHLVPLAARLTGSQELRRRVNEEEMVPFTSGANESQGSQESSPGPSHKTYPRGYKDGEGEDGEAERRKQARAHQVQHEREKLEHQRQNEQVKHNEHKQQEHFERER